MTIQKVVAGLSVYFLVFLAGCSQMATNLPAPDTPHVKLTETAIPSIPPTASMTAMASLTPSLTPEYIYAPDAGKPVYPLADLRILSPGDGSRLISPLRPELSILLGVENTVEVELLNSKGALLTKKLLRFPGVSSGQRILFQPEMDFEIDGEEESGRLVVKTFDDFERLTALASCDLTLLSKGVTKTEPAGIPYEAFLLTEPLAGTSIQGGVVEVSGYIRPAGRGSIVLELMDENGIGITNRVLNLATDPGGAPIIFSTTLPYQVDKETRVRLILRQGRGSIPGIAVATSLLLTIK